jgi:hypothetical protein
MKLPHTISGWISLAAMMVASMVTGTTGMKTLVDLKQGRPSDRRDIAAAVAFITLMMVAELLFLFAEGSG